MPLATRCLVVAAALFLAACSPLPTRAPRAPPQSSARPLFVAQPTYLVWSRADVENENATYETALVAADGGVVARRSGIFVSNGSSLHRVVIEVDRVPSLGCNMPLWEKKKADLPPDAFEDLLFDRVSIVSLTDATTSTVPSVSEAEVERNDEGVPIGVNHRSLVVVGSIGAKLSIVERRSAWPCGTMHGESMEVHGYDVATQKGDPKAAGCGAASTAKAQAVLEAGAAEDGMTPYETHCAGVTTSFDPAMRRVREEHFTSYAAPPVGSSFLMLEHSEITSDEREPMPGPVRAFAGTQPAVRGFSRIAPASAEAVRALFESAPIAP